MKLQKRKIGYISTVAITTCCLATFSQAASTIVSSGITTGAVGSVSGSSSYTNANTDDWAYWGADGGGSGDGLLAAADYSSEPGSRMISDVTKIVTTAFTAQDTTGAGRYDWNNGTNATTVNDYGGGIQVLGVNNGYFVTVSPGAISTLTVDFYGATYFTTATVTASIFDATNNLIVSASPLTISKISGNNMGKATFEFNIENASDYIRFDLVKTGTDSGSANAALSTVAVSNFTTAPVPEPSSVALLGLGGIALLLRRRK